MKTYRKIRSIVFVIIFILLSTGLCSASDPADSCSLKVWHKLREIVKYPDFAFQQAMEGEVEIIFKVSNEGQVTVYNVFATEPDLAAYVRVQLSSMRCDEPKAHNKLFRVKFHFKLI